MSRFLRLRQLISVAMSVFALQAVAASAHSVQHLAWTRVATEISQSTSSPASESDHPCAICVAGASLSHSLVSSTPAFLAPDFSNRLVTTFERLPDPGSDYRPGARAPPVLLS